MRILLLNYEFPPVGAGAATASAQIARHLVRRGMEVAVLTAHFKGLERVERRDGYTIHRVRSLRRHLGECSVPEMGAFVACAAVPALRLAESFRPDLLHVFFGMPTGPLGLLVHRLKGIPYLLSLRGGDVPGFMGADLALVHRLALPLTRLTWSEAGAIVVNSEGLRQLAERTLSGRRMEIVPNGVDLEAFRPREGPEEGDSRVRLLFVGRLARQKGVPHLLRALAGLDPTPRSRVELEIVGSGPEELGLRSMVERLGLGERVRFAGWVPRSAIVQHYQRADVFVLPSLDEGMPNVVLEAMACGKAIVASDIRGNRELVAEGVNGLLVPPAQPEALGRALERIIADAELRSRLGRTAREVASRYGWASTADRYLALSKQILVGESGVSEGPPGEAGEAGPSKQIRGG